MVYQAHGFMAKNMDKPPVIDTLMCASQPYDTT